MCLSGLSVDKLHLLPLVLAGPCDITKAADTSLTALPGYNKAAKYAFSGDLQRLMFCFCYLKKKKIIENFLKNPMNQH